MYLEQGNTRESKIVMQLQAIAKSYEKEATRTKRMLEAKQTIVAHQTQQIESEKDTQIKQNLPNMQTKNAQCTAKNKPNTKS